MLYLWQKQCNNNNTLWPRTYYRTIIHKRSTKNHIIRAYQISIAHIHRKVEFIHKFKIAPNERKKKICKYIFIQFAHEATRSNFIQNYKTTKTMASNTDFLQRLRARTVSQVAIQWIIIISEWELNFLYITLCFQIIFKLDSGWLNTRLF